MKRIVVIMVLALGFVVASRFVPVVHHGQAFAQDDGGDGGSAGTDDGGGSGGTDDGGGE
jgi:hypothetical protein